MGSLAQGLLARDKQSVTTPGCRGIAAAKCAPASQHLQVANQRQAVPAKDILDLLVDLSNRGRRRRINLRGGWSRGDLRWPGGGRSVLVSRGMNGEGKPWRVAIQKPTDRENAVQAIVDINGHGISTSGSYRNYYELDGKRISHVIDPQTGQPITHKLVSVTVIAPTALEADGWDTGLMVLGPEKAQQVVREEGLAVYMIVKEGEGFKTWMSPQFRTFLVGEKN